MDPLKQLELIQENKVSKELLGYCESRMTSARNHYKSNYEADWKTQRMHWEAKFQESQKTRKSERSKLVVPTTQVAVDTASSELDAAVGYLNFFQIEPIIPPEISVGWSERYGPVWDDMINNFKKDFVASNSRSEISEAIFNSALYDIGYLKVVSEEKKTMTLTPGEGGRGVEAQAVVRTMSRFVSVDPNNLWPDPSATCLEDSEYLVEYTDVADHIVKERIKEGLYRSVKLPPVDPQKGSGRFIFEYHGMVPKNLLESSEALDDDLQELVIPLNNEEEELVEAVVMWVEDTNEVLYAEATPFIDGRKSYADFPWDMNPGHLVGRGVARKVTNIQRAEDAGIRARIDALAYAVHPMIGIDGMKLVNRRKMKVGPGRQIITQGDPGNAITTFGFGDIPQSVFIQSEELSRMADNATGVAAFGGVDPKFQSGVGLDNLSQPAINRSRRTLEFLNNFLKRSLEILLWRGVQFDGDRYPPVMSGFSVSVMIGSLTRRSEMSQISAMLKTLPETSAAYWRLLVKFFELSDLPDKETVVGDIKVLAEKALNPPTPTPTIAEDLQLRQIEWTEKKNTQELKLQGDRVLAELVWAIAALEKIDSEEVKNQSKAILDLAKAEAEQLGPQMEFYKSVLEGLKRDAEGTKRELPGAASGPAPAANGVPRVGGIGGEG